MQCLTSFDFWFSPKNKIDENSIKEDNLLYVYKIVKYLKHQENQGTDVYNYRKKICENLKLNGPSNPHILYKELTKSFLKDGIYSQLIKENLFATFKISYRCKSRDCEIDNESEEVSIVNFNSQSIVKIST